MFNEARNFSKDGRGNPFVIISARISSDGQYVTIMSFE